MSGDGGQPGGEVYSIRSGDLSLVFERRDDRWTHAILIGTEPVARAVEWDAGRDDPARVAGPVFQDLHIQADPEGRLQALLVGQSGRHHFSASFTAVGREGGSRIAVDVADRCRDPLAALASTYTAFIGPGDLFACGEREVGWGFSHRILWFFAGPPALASIAEAGRRATQVQVAVDGDRAGPTHRWQYAWAIDNRP